MKNERVLIADDQSIVIDQVRRVIENYGKSDGHKVVGEATSVSEVKKILNEGLRPTVALVDGNFPLKGDGEKAAAIIKKLSPDTTIIAFSSTPQNYGDDQWNKHMSKDDLIDCLTNLEH